MGSDSIQKFVKYFELFESTKFSKINNVTKHKSALTEKGVLNPNLHNVIRINKISKLEPNNFDRSTPNC